ncbi:hypothetical protein HMPREF9162_0571 [Selenomonas sp. oral taxon 137 str. F0430]|uniref:hypothetical protein n=1 Tax=Selenomonas sp. oral taxon 137 TaxID=712531 RepID=UPI0001EB2256|nr:hypothetical protein [Selenomonas sp. oral taxon 137]EFR41831.1 hypothetical protein HMPREF9162_0571 [Selenomonas sp. oral taxon 137 str. F0430]
MKSYFVIKVLAVIMGIGLTLYAWLLAYSYYTPVCLPETTNIAGFRYQMYFDDQVLSDVYEDVALEMNCYAHEYKFPYLYAYGESGYTKICVIPLFTKIIKIENYASDARMSWDGPSNLVSNLKDLQEAYGSSLILIEDLDDISIEDKKIFLELRRQGEARKQRSLKRAKTSQEKDIIKDLDEISEALEESLRKQELAQEQE